MIRDDALFIAELAEKVLYWKDRARRAETAERMFATEIYSGSRTQPQESPNAE